MFPGIRSSRYSNPRYEELQRQQLQTYGLGGYSPALSLKQPAQPGIDPGALLRSLTVDPLRGAGEAVGRAITPPAEKPQTMPLPGTLAYMDVARRKMGGEDMSKAANDRRARMQARLEEIGGMAPGPEGEGAPAGDAQALLDQMPGEGGGGPGGLDVQASLLPPGGVLPEHAGLDFESFQSNPIGSGGARPAPAPSPAPPAIEELPSAAPGLDIGPGSEARFAQDERDAKLERAKRMQSVSEGLNLAGRSIAGLSGAKIPELDDRDYAAEREIVGMEDQLTASERQALEAVGLKIPPGTRRSTLSMILPAITGMRQQGLRQQAQTGAARTAAEARGVKEETRVREREEDITRRTGERQEDITRKTAATERAAGKISDKELKDIDNFDNQLRGLKSIAEERIDKDYSTGPIDQYVAKAGRMTGFQSGEEAEWRRRVKDQLNKHIRESTGAVMNKAEVPRLLGALPVEGDPEHIFDSKIAGVIKELEAMRATYMENREKAGKDMSAFAMEPESTEESITYIVPGTGPESGPADVPLSRIKEFETKYPNAERQRRR